MTTYLVDSNVFIQAKNLHYGFDFCPAFWDWLIEQNGAGKVASIEKVADELQAGGDELAAWAAALGEEFFMPPDDAVLHMRWLTNVSSSHTKFLPTPLPRSRFRTPALASVCAA